MVLGSRLSSEEVSDSLAFGARDFLSLGFRYRPQTESVYTCTIFINTEKEKNSPISLSSLFLTLTVARFTIQKQERAIFYLTEGRRFHFFHCHCFATDG